MKRLAWTGSRARLSLFALAVVVWLPLLAMPAEHWSDFSAFYAGGKFAFGPAVMDVPATLAWQTQQGLRLVPFLYPPAFSLLYVPFAALPFDVAAAINVVVEASLLLAAAVVGARVYGIPRSWAILGTLAWYPAAEGVISGQNSALLLLLVVLTAAGLSKTTSPGIGTTPQSAASPLAARASRGTAPDFASGLAAGPWAGLASYRPHLGLPLFFLAIWRRAWGAVAVSLVLIGAQYILGVLASGGAWNWPITWLRALTSETGADFLAQGWQSLGLPANLSRISILGSAPGSFFGPALAGYFLGAVLVWKSRRRLREWPAPRAVALLCALALFAGPRGWIYDGTLLLPALAVFAADSRRAGWPNVSRRLLATAYGLAIASPIGIAVGMTPLALVVLVAPFVLLGIGPFAGGAAAPSSAEDPAFRDAALGW